MLNRFLALALAAAAALLAGCAAPQLDASVSSFGAWPAGRVPAGFAFERLPSQQAHANEQDRLEAFALPALAQAGFRLVLPGEPPDVRVQVAARTIQGQVVYPDPFVGPFWGGPGLYGPRWRGPGWGWGPAWGPGWGAGWGTGWGPGWGPGFAYPYFVFEVSLLIVDAASQQPLYETRAGSDGAGADDATWAALFTAALKDFPYPAVSPRRVTVDLRPK